MLCERTSANRRERVLHIDKMGVTGSSQVPPHLGSPRQAGVFVFSTVASFADAPVRSFVLTLAQRDARAVCESPSTQSSPGASGGSNSPLSWQDGAVLDSVCRQSQNP